VFGDRCGRGSSIRCRGLIRPRAYRVPPQPLLLRRRSASGTRAPVLRDGIHAVATHGQMISRSDKGSHKQLGDSLWECRPTEAASSGPPINQSRTPTTGSTASMLSSPSFDLRPQPQL
jgi:hypothetical protein